MISLLVAAVLFVAPSSDTVLTTDGGRVVGSVLEESATAGVTIQSPDGTVRHIAAGEVARIEFSDGTVSERRPVKAAPATATPAPGPAPSAPAGPPDAIFFVGGGRARGTVIQEDPGGGAKLRLLDGSIHTYGPDEFTRIEYADGTVSRRKAAEAPPAAPPPPRQEPLPAAGFSAPDVALDSVYFLAGGRVRGTVIEDHPTTGVRIRQLDGSLRTYRRDELDRIEYADGTVSRRKTPAPQAAPAPTPQAAPPAPPPPEPKATLAPIYLSLGAGVTWFGGNAATGLPMSQLFTSQAHLSSELGLRLSPAWAIGVYGDAGGGELPASVRQQCMAQSMGMDCLGVAGRVGFLLRHTWSPLSPVSKWFTIGTGWEIADVSVNDSQATSFFTFTGRELVRLGAGFDFRSSEVLGIGGYASFSWGEYDQYKDTLGSTSLDRRTHTTGQVGLRLTLFP